MTVASQMYRILYMALKPSRDIIPISEARARLPELMDANAKGETKFITRNGRTESVLMSVSEYEYLTELTGPDWHPNQLRRALEDIEQGNVFSEEESRTMMKQVMARARGKREATKARHHK